MKKNKSFSFKDILTILSMLITLVFLLILGIQAYTSFARLISDKFERINHDQLAQTTVRLETILINQKNLTGFVATDEDLLLNLFNYRNSSPGGRFTINTDIIQNIERVRLQYEYITDIIILSDNHSFVSFDGSYSDKKLDLRLWDLPSEYLDDHIGNGSIFFFTPQNSGKLKDYVVFENKYGFLSGLYHNDVFLGVLMITLNDRMFSDSIAKELSIFLVNGENEIVLQPEKSIDSGISTSDSGASILVKTEGFLSSSIFDNQFKLFLMPGEQLKAEYSFLRTWIFILFFTSSIFTWLLSKSVSKKISTPLARISKSIQRYKIDVASEKLFHNDKRINLTLRETILYFLMLVIMVPVIMFLIISYMVSTSRIDQYITDGHNNLIQQASKNLDDYFSVKERVIRNIIYHEVIHKALSNDSLNNEPKVALDEIRGTVDRSIQLSPGKESVYIFSTDFTPLYSNYDPVGISQEELMQKVELLNKKNRVILWYKSEPDRYNRSMISALAKITELRDLEVLGYMHFMISEIEVRAIYDHTSGDDFNMLLMDHEHRIISHQDKTMLDSYHDEKSTHVMLNRSLSFADWILVGESSIEVMQSERRQLIYEKFYISIIMLFLIIAISFMFSYSLTKPLNYFRKLMSKVCIDNIEILFPEQNIIQEINELGTSFNEMILRNEKLIDDLVLSTRVQSQLEEQKKDAELIALQAQINPHFLYNTFDSISWMVKCNNKEQALDMIKDLSDLLRYAANSSMPIVSISDEIDYVRSYSKIMKLRFDNRLDFVWDIEHCILNNQIIRLTLQPIIENAIYHGIQSKSLSGTIRVYGYAQKDIVVLGIKDDGMGISNENIKKIMHDLKNDDFSGKIGLHNVDLRLKLFFGDKYGIHITSIYGKGTTVEMHIPQHNFHQEDS